MTSNPLSDLTGEVKADEGDVEGAAGGNVSVEWSGAVDFPCVKSLNIGSTPIRSWESVDELRRQFPQLGDVRLHGIACGAVIG